MNTETYYKAWTERLTQKFSFSPIFGPLWFVGVFYALITVFIGWFTNHFVFSNPLWYGWVVFFLFTFLCVTNYPKILRLAVRQLSDRFSFDKQRQKAFRMESEKLAFGKPMSYFSLISSPFFFTFFLCFIITGNYVPIVNIWIDLYGLSFIVTFFTPTLWMAIASVIIVDRISKKEKLLILEVLDPERCGGLKPIGHLLLVGAAMWSIGLAVSIALSILRVSPVVLVVIVLSSVTSSFWFVFPQLRIHSFMSNLKQTEMKELSKQFSEVTQLFLETDLSRDEQLLLFEKSAFVLRVYEQTEKMNTWPFDTSVLLKFISLVLLPVTTYILRLITLA